MTHDYVAENVSTDTVNIVTNIMGVLRHFFGQYNILIIIHDPKTDMINFVSTCEADDVTAAMDCVHNRIERIAANVDPFAQDH